MSLTLEMLLMASLGLSCCCAKLLDILLGV